MASSAQKLTSYNNTDDLNCELNVKGKGLETLMNGSDGNFLTDVGKDKNYMELSIDHIFPQTCEKQRRSHKNQKFENCDEEDDLFLGDIDSDSQLIQPTYCSCIVDWIFWFLYPITCLLYYSFCCCLCRRGQDPESIPKLVAKIKKQIKHRK